MTNSRNVVIKAAAYVLKADQDGMYKLLICSIASKPHVEARVPGGNIEPNENIREALFRELEEESGLKELKIIRKLGVDKYYKDYISSNVERHDYLLLAPTETPDNWEHSGTGHGGDRGTVFIYKWISSNELNELTQELRTHITSERVPELFTG